MHELDFHEVANIFPMMSDDEFCNLVADIRENGQREAIWTYQGKIIDGRNRYKACREIGIEPKTREWDGQGSLVAFVVSMNLYRRQLTTIEKIEVAKKMKPMLAEEAAKRMKIGTNQYSPTAERPEPSQKGETNVKVGNLVGVGGRTITKYERVERDGAAELIEAMKQESVSIDKADQIARYSQEQQRELLRQHKETPHLRIVKPGEQPVKPKPKSAKQINAEYLASRPEAISTEEEIALKKSLENLTSELAKLVAGIQIEIANMANIQNIQYVVETYVDAVHKYADDIQVSLDVKRAREKREKNG